MPTPVKFDGSNVVIAENQEPYLPLPARVMGDAMGTVLTCWEFTDEELNELTRTRRLWVSHWTFNLPFQPLMVSVDQPVAEVAPAPRLTLYGWPAEQLKYQGFGNDPEGFNGDGWYFWDALHIKCHGPHPDQFTCEKAMRKYAHEKGDCGCASGSPCDV